MPEKPEPAAGSANVRRDHSPWNWLLVIPIVLPMLTFLFNRKEPTLFGFPAFYWFQLVFVLVGVATTVTVYRMTRRAEGRVSDHG